MTKCECGRFAFSKNFYYVDWAKDCNCNYMYSDTDSDFISIMYRSNNFFIFAQPNYNRLRFCFFRESIGFEIICSIEIKEKITNIEDSIIFLSNISNNLEFL